VKAIPLACSCKKERASGRGGLSRVPGREPGPPVSRRRWREENKIKDLTFWPSGTRGGRSGSRWSTIRGWPRGGPAEEPGYPGDRDCKRKLSTRPGPDAAGGFPRRTFIEPASPSARRGVRISPSTAPAAVGRISAQGGPAARHGQPHHHPSRHFHDEPDCAA
jgi:hypothetical protein